jgi:MFS family permease
MTFMQPLTLWSAPMRRRRELLPYYALVATATMSLGVVFTMLAEFRDQLGFSESSLGLMVAMGFFAAFVSQVGLARFADRGHAKAMIRLGLAALVVSLFAMAVSTELWQFVLARMVLGVGIGTILPAVRRIVIAFDPQNVGANIGLLGSFDVSGFVAGPLLAALLVETVGFRSPFVVLGIATAAFLPAVARMPADTGEIAHEQRVVRVLLRRRGIQAALIVAMGWFAMIGTFEAVWAVLLTDRGADTWLIGLTLSIIVAPMIVLAPFGGRLAQRRGPLRVAAVGVLAGVPCVVVYGFVESIPLLTVFALFQGFSDAVTFPASQVGAAMAAEPTELAAAQGLLGASLELTAGVMALVAGVVYDQWGAGLLFSLTGAVMIAGVVVALTLARPLAAQRHPTMYGSPGPVAVPQLEPPVL